MKFKYSLLLAIALSFSLAGCNLFNRSKKPRNLPIASDVEADFRTRWMERRVTELTAGGTDAAAARQQADGEFREKFPYLQKAKK